MDLLPFFIPIPADSLTLPASVLAGAIWVALAVDRWLGEPPVSWHPVVWMGNYLSWAGQWLQRHSRQNPHARPDYQAFCLGALAWTAGAALVWIAAVGIQAGAVWLLMQGLVYVNHAGVDAQWIVASPVFWGIVFVAGFLMGVVLKPMLSWELLKTEVLAVEHALSDPRTGSLIAGRDRLRWLVSRDVASLTDTQVRESAIETLAENLNDSVIAPLFWFVLLGLPGAALFRFANTGDAMWGYPGVYQGGQWRWAGKWAAHADDVLAWIPARLTALLLLLAAGGPSLARLRVEARRTPSPNSGWPMAAMALALDVRLGKSAVYVLNAGGRAPQPDDTPRAVFCASKALLALVFIAHTAIVCIAFVGSP